MENLTYKCATMNMLNTFHASGHITQEINSLNANLLLNILKGQKAVPKILTRYGD